MAFIVETGSGLRGANAYVWPSFVTTYLTERGRETENGWSTATTAEQQEKIVAATDYADKRFGLRLGGVRLRDFIPGRAASGVLTLTGLPTSAQTLTIGQRVYRIVSALSQEDDVLLGATIAETIANLVAAINFTGTAGVTYHADTQANLEVIAIDGSPSLQVYAQVKGDSGNQIAFATTFSNGTVSGSGTFAGGLDEGAQSLELPRRNLYTPKGVLVVGIPMPWKQAIAEYAVRAQAAALLPDPTVDASLVPVISKRERVGPIDENITYGAGGISMLVKPYPDADRLISQYLVSSGGGVIRG